MPRGFAGYGGGGSNMNNLMKQAQKMQRDMEKVKESLSEILVEAGAGGGAVKVTANCDKQITELTIDPSVVDPDDVEMLQDLLMVAINEVIEKAEQRSTEEMNKVTGGLGGFPGL